MAAPPTAPAAPDAARLRVEADLTLTVETPHAEDDPGRRLTGRITGSGSTLTVRLGGLDALPLGNDLRTAMDPVRDVARLLADDGLTVVVEGDHGRILSLGRVRASILDRAVTGSRHIALHDRRAALRLARSRGGRGSAVAAGPGAAVHAVAAGPDRRPAAASARHDHPRSARGRPATTRLLSCAAGAGRCPHGAGPAPGHHDDRLGPWGRSRPHGPGGRPRAGAPQPRHRRVRGRPGQGEVGAGARCRGRQAGGPTDRVGRLRRRVVADLPAGGVRRPRTSPRRPGRRGVRPATTAAAATPVRPLSRRPAVAG